MSNWLDCFASMQIYRRILVACVWNGYFIGGFAQTMDYWHSERNNEYNRKLSAKLLLQILSIRSITTSCHSVIGPSSRPPLMTAVVWSATPSWLGFCCADGPGRLVRSNRVTTTRSREDNNHNTADVTVVMGWERFRNSWSQFPPRSRFPCPRASLASTDNNNNMWTEERRVVLAVSDVGQPSTLERTLGSWFGIWSVPL